MGLWNQEILLLIEDISLDEDLNIPKEDLEFALYNKVLPHCIDTFFSCYDLLRKNTASPLTVRMNHCATKNSLEKICI